MTIYDIPEIIKTSLPLALNQMDIQAIFRWTEIYSFN